MNLAALLDRAGRSARERPAVTLGSRVLWSYGELAERAARLAGGLRRRYGLGDGARVLIAMKNHPAYVELLFACWRAGLAAVPVNAKLHAKEFRYILGHSGAQAVFVTPDLEATLAEAAKDAKGVREIVDVDSRAYRRLPDGEPAGMAEVGADDLAWLFYTSGTTGRPKGAVLTHRNLMAMTLSYFADVDTVTPGDSILHAAPMSHGSGLYTLPHVAGFATQAVPESGGFDPAEIFGLLPDLHGVAMFAAPTMVKRLIDHPQAADADVGHLKTIVYGGGPMYVADLKRAMQRFGQRFVQIYGQGESPMTITALSRSDHMAKDHPRHEARLGSVGRAQTVVAVRVADEADATLPPGEPGEVLVRGDSVMPGYWQNPEASAETLRGGWLHTGDVGAMDADGYLTLMDRSKDVIISGGANIYPREIEEVLLADDRVQECAVVGRPHPEWGEEVVAFVVPRPGAQPTREELDRLCLAEMARFKRPREWRFVEALAKNEAGKILKTALREQLAEERDAGGG